MAPFFFRSLFQDGTGWCWSAVGSEGSLRDVGQLCGQRLYSITLWLLLTVRHGFSMALIEIAGYAVKEGKKHAGPQPQKWVRVAAQAKGTFQKVQGCQCCSAANMTATSNAKTCVPPAAVYRTLGATPGTPRYQSWLTSALRKATPGKAARLAFASGNVDSWGAGPCLRVHIYIHHAEAALN